MRVQKNNLSIFLESKYPPWKRTAGSSTR